MKRERFFWAIALLVATTAAANACEAMSLRQRRRLQSSKPICSAHLDKFTWIGGFSSAPNKNPPTELTPDPVAARATRAHMAGMWKRKKGGLINISQEVHKYLKGQNVPYAWHVDAHGHDPAEWSNNL
jgi:hypothetical protein